MKQKYLLLSMIIFVFLFSATSLYVLAVTPNLELTPPTQSVTVGNQANINVEVEVEAEEVTNLRRANITLNFDASKFQYISSVNGGFIPSATLLEQSIDNTNGSVILDIAGLGASAYASGSGTIMTVVFERIATDTTNITFGSTELRDKYNITIIHTQGSGCLIASLLGDFYPDGCVDFEDLMIFAMHYGESDVIADVFAFTYTYQSSMNKPQDKLGRLVEEGKIPDSYRLDELPPSQKGVVEHSINVYWRSYPEAIGYRIYRLANGIDFGVVEDLQPSSVSDWYSIWDYDVTEGGIYCYYITAYGDDWETNPSQIVTISTWLPPCSLVSPADQSIITDPNPTFTWTPVGISSLPYGAIQKYKNNI